MATIYTGRCIRPRAIPGRGWLEQEGDETVRIQSQSVEHPTADRTFVCRYELFQRQ